MFDPSEHHSQCEIYLGHCLGHPLKLLRAERLAQSTRQAPWRLDVEVGGKRRSYVLQLDERGMQNEYLVLKTLEPVPLPTPHVYGLDLQGEALGVPCFFSDFIDGDSLLEPVLSGERWAEDLYLDSVLLLLDVSEDDLGEIAQDLERTSTGDVLEEAYTKLKSRHLPLADQVYRKLKAEMPSLPPVRFSNGDLWLENFIAREGVLAGVIDFQGAGFSDPLFEFLLSFFVEPQLQGRGLEERFCRRIGVDPVVLAWYHGLEYFDTWPWLLDSGENFVHHSADSVETSLKKWLDGYQIN